MSLPASPMLSAQLPPTDVAGPANAPAAGATFKPAFALSETTDAFHVEVALPGVNKDGLEVLAKDGQVRITGRRAWRQPADWISLHRETSDDGYELVLTHDRHVDTGRVTAELRDGVLRVALPKAEEPKPRKIAII